ncbi:MAG: glutamate--tRNA ligase family protein, partial [Alphaproteobacteria bacterium]|nr:glutamate--tRNA ligase family protein [Alphaproteobacteria bacterium]
MSAILRFAPSPTGRLHLGHAYSALFTWRQAEAVGGRVLLRIEDIDRGRCRPEFEAGIFADLAWLGLEWETPVRRQSEHLDDYARALQRLEGRGLLYPCFCTRADIRREIAASPSAPHGTDGPVYPGTCRKLSADERAARRAIEAHALRLDVAASLDRVDAEVLTWEDAEAGRQVADPA